MHTPLSSSLPHPLICTSFPSVYLRLQTVEFRTGPITPPSLPRPLTCTSSLSPAASVYLRLQTVQFRTDPIPPSSLLPPLPRPLTCTSSPSPAASVLSLASDRSVLCLCSSWFSLCAAVCPAGPRDCPCCFCAVAPAAGSWTSLCRGERRNEPIYLLNNTSPSSPSLPPNSARMHACIVVEP